MNNLVLKDLNVFYGSFHAVKHVDLEVPEGQIVALLGGSGSGKSSLLRAIAGLEDSTGVLQFASQDLRTIPVHRRHFGLMFQDGQLFGHRSVAGNIEFGMRSLPRSRRGERVEQLLHLVGLPGFAQRRISTLSGGQQQRVALARALAPQPRLLLLDEPLSALDRSLREQLAVEIRRVVKEQGVTAIYVTHDQQEAFTVADRVLVMDAGRVLRDATPVQIWRDPQHLEVAQFLGFAPIVPLDLAVELGIYSISEGGVGPSPLRKPIGEGLCKWVACAPEAFEYVERNTPESFSARENYVEAEVLAVRVGRAVAELEVSLLGAEDGRFFGRLTEATVLQAVQRSMAFQLGDFSKLRFVVTAPLEFLEESSGRVTLRVKSESVCLVTSGVAPVE